ncbi:class I SAM-dependent methyltransferase [Streptomyces sp. NPDC002889]|uniref:class I SAM-dependent methyltransferase n=1 Tax=Streptomyces sp. NPDC002889 TaxID=3364669 RepID=UPI0036B33A5C
MLDYDREAVLYDATRGGVPRAEAAAAALLGLVPPSARTLLDIGCGTGLVTGRLIRPGLRVFGADGSHGMARKAVERTGGRVVLGDVRRLPLRDAAVDAVSAIWLLHLVAEASAVVAEAARVLRPGGVFITTVDKDAGHDVGADIDAVLAPHRSFDAAFDRADLIERHAGSCGMRPAGSARFAGHGQGRTPRSTAEALLAGRFRSWFGDGGATAGQLAAELATLPGQDVRRAEPSYVLRAFRKEGRPQSPGR